ncbi:MAG: ROK family protein, partial [Victivallales bacterium]|nr:ROK family protein [Victivallales bacterium]
MNDNRVKIRIMDVICAADGLSSKKSVREATGFAWNTVGRIVDQLTSEHILLEKRSDPTQPGRPITHLELNPDNQLLAGLALGGSWWRFVLCDYSFNTIFTIKIPTPQWRGGDNFLKAIYDFILSSLQQAGCSPKRLFCIGIASSGTIDPKNGVLVSSLNMGVEAGVHLPMQQELKAMLKKPVLVSISTVATAWAEYKFGAYAGTRNLLTVGISIGIGAGVVIDGKALVG